MSGPSALFLSSPERLLPPASLWLTNLAMGDETKKGLTVLVCGGGNAAQVATSMFASRYETYAISLYADEAAKWKKHMMGGRWHDKVEGMELTLDTGKKLISTPTDISNDPSLSGKADVIILAVPSFAHGQYFEAFYPYIKPGTIVACMPARSGGDILFASKMKEKADSMAFVGFETLPWACRFTEWGKRATILAPRVRSWLPWPRSRRVLGPLLPCRACWESIRPLRRAPTIWALAWGILDRWSTLGWCMAAGARRNGMASRWPRNPCSTRAWMTLPRRCCWASLMKSRTCAGRWEPHYLATVCGRKGQYSHGTGNMM